jgi:hypothetical protein
VRVETFDRRFRPHLEDEAFRGVFRPRNRRIEAMTITLKMNPQAAREKPA